MAAASDFLENKIIDHILRGQSYTVPATVYLALATTLFTDAGGGVELTGGSYARQACALNAASGGTTSNTSDETFVVLPACTIVGWGLFDASGVGAGNLLVHAPLSSPKVITAGQSAIIYAGDLDISVA